MDGAEKIAAAEIQRTETGYEVSVPAEKGFIRFNFEEVEQPKARTIEAEMTAWQDAPNAESYPFSIRLNILSLNQRDMCIRQLRQMYGRTNWAAPIHRACQLVKAAWYERDWSVDLAGVEVSTETRYTIRPIIPEGLPTILFGPGGAGKSYLAEALAKAFITAVPLFGEMASPSPVLMVDYEGREEEAKRRLTLLGMTDYSQFIYWPAMGRPLAEMGSALLRKCLERDVGLVIVDSAALACGGDPKDEQVATAYFNALAKLRRSSLTISHMTKDEKDDVHPFGSIYWFNSARSVWNLKGPEEDENPKHLALFNRKSNEDVRHKPMGLSMAFGENITVEREDLASEFMVHLSLSQRLRRALRVRGKSVKELGEELDEDAGKLRVVLNRMKGVRVIGDSEDGSKLWGLSA